MENQNNSNQDCGCSDGCCTPSTKSNPWKKWIFIAIVVVAAAIVTVKLVNKDNTEPVKCCDKTENASCCPNSKSEADSSGCGNTKCEKSTSGCTKTECEKNTSGCAKTECEKSTKCCSKSKTEE